MHRIIATGQASHYVISREGVMQCNVIACLCFSLFLNVNLMLALSFTFSINMFSVANLAVLGCVRFCVFF